MEFWTLEEATTVLPEVRALVSRLRELVAAARTSASGNGAKASRNGHGPAVQPESAELRDVLEELTGRGIIVRDPERGLIDFPARADDGRTYLLCWLDGEDAIEWWHWPEDGFAGRTPLSEPPT
ncbi:MAG: DUF2203 family protein [Actinobacteria bacterium]|nr:DUF2203 family protein [Actinomycetota bacterium]